MYGVIDIGSNTIRLSFYRLAGGKIDPMMNKKEVAGLASYIKKNNKMNQEGIAKLIQVLEEYKQIPGKVDIKEMFAFATASVRNVENEKEILKKVKMKRGSRTAYSREKMRVGWDTWAPCSAQTLMTDFWWTSGAAVRSWFFTRKNTL